MKQEIVKVNSVTEVGLKAVAKKAYGSPSLTEYGKLVELTRSGQSGSGDTWENQSGDLSL